MDAKPPVCCLAFGVKVGPAVQQTACRSVGPKTKPPILLGDAFLRLEARDYKCCLCSTIMHNPFLAINQENHIFGLRRGGLMNNYPSLLFTIAGEISLMHTWCVYLCHSSPDVEMIQKMTPNSSTSACLTPRQEMFITNKAITLDGDISKICDQLLLDSKLEYFDLFPGDICWRPLAVVYLGRGWMLTHPAVPNFF